VGQRANLILVEGGGYQLHDLLHGTQLLLVVLPGGGPPPTRVQPASSAATSCTTSRTRVISSVAGVGLEATAAASRMLATPSNGCRGRRGMRQPLQLFQAASEAGVSRFVFISRCAVHEVSR
jgi:hypothetical protein